MPIRLEAIKFNHNPSSATADALSIRRDATTFVTVPEWRNGVSVTPEDSPAAYSIGDTNGHVLTIQAQFTSTWKKTREIQVRAVDPTIDPPGGSGCLGWILRLIAIFIRAIAGNVLGDVKPKTVTVPGGGTTGFISFDLQNVRLWTAGVGARTTTWNWQYRLGSGAWHDFATSTHRIYSLLAIPTAPWQQTPYSISNIQLPWTRALDKACAWAILKTNPVDAGGAVTRAIYNLGPSVIEYDCPGGGSTRYASGSLDLTAFLDRLGGGPGRGKYLNCSDCATFTSTFSNLLGCALWQSQMGYGFGLNPNLSIGAPMWQPSCGWNGFSYHEVAWTGGCTAGDHVYDACLQVDGDADPTTAPHTPLLPVHMIFGTPGSGDYLDRLVPPATRAACDPQPSTRQHRAVY